jgi:thiazole synthase
MSERRQRNAGGKGGDKRPTLVKGEGAPGVNPVPMAPAPGAQGETKPAVRELARPVVEPGNGKSGAEVKLLNEPRTVADVQANPDALVIADTTFRSRLIVGTGKYSSNDVMVKALRASGAQMITVAVRRVDLDRGREEGVLHHLDPHEFFLLANTAGCYTADEAVRYARLARSAGFNEWLKLEVIGDERTLLPDTQATVEAARRLVEDGFKVMAYTSDDVVTALRLEDAGCVAVMPLASPIGSGLGIVNPYFIREIKRRCAVPIIVDAGVGTASDACIAMEQGMDGVLMNTAIAAAEDPVTMAEAMKHGVRAGRLAFLAGRMKPREIAVPSSPTRGMLD